MSHPFLPARALSYKPSFLPSWVNHLPADKAPARALCYPIGALPSNLPQKSTCPLWLIARPATEDTNYCDPIPSPSNLQTALILQGVLGMGPTAPHPAGLLQGRECALPALGICFLFI